MLRHPALTATETTTTTTSRLRRTLSLFVVTIVLAMLAAVGGGLAGAAPASASPSIEGQFLSLLNGVRANAGLGPLSADAGLVNVARDWSARMTVVYARTGDPVVKPSSPNDCTQSSLCHRPDLTSAVAAVEPNWSRIGENLGVGGSVATIHDMLWNSAPHRSNMLGDYNRVGVGVAVSGSKIWVTFDFLKGPAIAAPPSLSVQVSAPPAAAVSTIARNSRYNPVAPVRLVDTRSGHGVAQGFVGAGGTLRLTVAGRSVPAGATGAVVNLTATESQGAGYLTAYPCGAAKPLASNLNVRRGETRANLATVALDGTGQVCVATSTTTHLVIDLAGWFGPSGNGYQPATPQRLLDTRTSGGRRTSFVVDAGTAVPGGATAATMNLTATNPAASGFLTAYPCGSAAPLASNLNFTPNQTVANLATVKLGSGRKVCLVSNVPTDLVVDLAGSFGSGGNDFTSAVPSRFLDTRDSTGGWLGQLGSMQRIELAIGGSRGVPGGATAVAVNLTVTGSNTGGFVVAYPCDQPMPTASNLNFAAGDTAANLAVVRLPSTGKLCISSNVSTHLVADVAGWFTS